eukprot:g74218.t1
MLCAAFCIDYRMAAAEGKAEGKVNKMPLFICRPHEFKLLRDNLTDAKSYSKTYTEYLQECADFVKAAVR